MIYLPLCKGVKISCYNITPRGGNFMAEVNISQSCFPPGWWYYRREDIISHWCPFNKKSDKCLQNYSQTNTKQLEDINNSTSDKKWLLNKSINATVNIFIFSFINLFFQSISTLQESLCSYSIIWTLSQNCKKWLYGYIWLSLTGCKQRKHAADTKKHCRQIA